MQFNLVLKLHYKRLVIILISFFLFSVASASAFYAIDQSLTGFQLSSVYAYEDQNPSEPSVVISGNLAGNKVVSTSGIDDFLSVYSVVQSKVLHPLWMFYSVSGDSFVNISYLDTNTKETIPVRIVEDEEFRQLTEENVTGVIINPELPQNQNASSVAVEIKDKVSILTVTTRINKNSKYYSINKDSLTNSLVISNLNPLVENLLIKYFNLYIKIDHRSFNAIERLDPPSLARRVVEEPIRELQSDGYFPSVEFSIPYQESSTPDTNVQFQYVIILAFTFLASPIFVAVSMSVIIVWRFFIQSLGEEFDVLDHRGFNIRALLLKLSVQIVVAFLLSELAAVFVFSFIFQKGQLFGTQMSVLLSSIILCVLLVVLNSRWSRLRVNHVPEVSPASPTAIPLFALSIIILTVSLVATRFVGILRLTLPIVFGVAGILLVIVTFVNVVIKHLIPRLYRYYRRSDNLVGLLTLSRMRINTSRFKRSLSTSFVIFLVIFLLVLFQNGFHTVFRYNSEFELGGSMVISTFSPLSDSNLSDISDSLDYGGRLISSRVVVSNTTITRYPITLISMSANEIDIIQRKLGILLLSGSDKQIWDNGSFTIVNSVVKYQREPVLDEGRLELNHIWFGGNTSQSLKLIRIVDDLPMTHSPSLSTDGGWSAIVSNQTFNSLIERVEDAQVMYKYILVDDVDPPDEGLEGLMRYGVAYDRVPDLSYLDEFFKLDDLFYGIMVATVTMIILYYGSLTIVTSSETNHRFKTYSLLKVDRSKTALIGMLEIGTPLGLSLIFAFVLGNILSYLAFIFIAMVGFRFGVVQKMRNQPFLSPPSFLVLALIALISSVLLASVFYIIRQNLSLSREKDRR